MGVKAIRWDSSLHPSITIEKSDAVHAVHAYTMQGVRALTRQRHCLSTNFVLAGIVLSQSRACVENCAMSNSRLGPRKTI